MSKSTPTPPAAPDPAALANAQSAANINTATEQQRLNLLNSSGPNGSVTYSADPSSPGGYSQQTTLSPGQQSIYDSNQALAGTASQVANDQLTRVNGALQQGLQAPTYQTQIANSGPVTSNITSSGGIQTGINGLGPLQSSYGSGGAIQSSYAPGSPIQSSYGSGGPIQSSYGNGGQIQGQVGDNNASGAVNQAANTAWQQAISRLAPAYGLQSNQLDARLASQGIGINSAAYGNAHDIFGRQVNDALNQAAYGAVSAGDAEQNTLYGQALASGNFANAAQAQGNQQNLQAGNFANAAQAQGNQQNLQAGNFANEAQQQGNQQNLQAGTFVNNAQAQSNNQNLNAAQLANQTALAQFQAGQAQGQFANQAQQQQYSQNAQTAAFANQAQQQQYLQNQGTAQFANQAANQQFQSNAEAQNQPINQLTALAGLGQVQTPTGINYTPTAVAPTDVVGATALSQQQQNANYQTQMQQQNGLFGGLFQLGAAGIGLL